MRRPSILRIARACLGALPLFLAVTVLAAEKGETPQGFREWIQSPGRHFRDGQPVGGRRALVFDEADDPALREQLGAELARLDDELYRRQGWRPPFAEGEPLRIYVSRSPSGAAIPAATAASGSGRGAEPVLLLEAAGRSSAEIVREAARRVARATLDGYGVEDPFLSPALAEYLAAPAGDIRDDETWTLAAAGQLDFRGRPAALGRFWVAEAARAAGPTSLREAWQRAAEGGEAPMDALLRAIEETTGRPEESITLAAAARIYAALEPEASPSRLRLLDVESGAIDASAPVSLAARHRSFLPETEETLRVSWPQDGAAGAAVVRYRDAALPPDVVFFAAGDRRALPLAGVARVDWLIAGSATGGRGVAAPVYADLSATVPYSGLEARAAADADGPRLTWTTESHEGLWGWAVFREEVLADGRIARTGPEIVPSALSSAQSFRYEYLDSGSARGTYYRYTIWAVTGEGLLARAFSATIKTAD